MQPILTGTAMVKHHASHAVQLGHKRQRRVACYSLTLLHMMSLSDTHRPGSLKGCIWVLFSEETKLRLGSNM